MQPASTKALFAGTIFISAFLLFLVQPLVAKQILPWFGGSAAVCLPLSCRRGTRQAKPRRCSQRGAR